MASTSCPGEWGAANRGRERGGDGRRVLARWLQQAARGWGVANRGGERGGDGCSPCSTASTSCPGVGSGE